MKALLTAILALTLIPFASFAADESAEHHKGDKHHEHHNKNHEHKDKDEKHEETKSF